MPSPTLVIAPGSYASALVYYDLRDYIRKLYPALPEVLIYDLLSASSGPPLPPPSLSDDGEFFSARISELADEGKDVVVLGHSYGGLVIREAVKGLSKEERAKHGKKGGVVSTIYLTAVVAEPGQSLADTFSTVSLDSLVPYEPGSTDYFRQDVAKSAPICFSDLPHREAIKWAGRFTLQTGISFATPATELSDYDKSIPSTYIFCTEDKVLSPDYQRERIEILKKASGEEKVKVVELNTGHCPNVSAPEALAKIIGSLLST